MAKEPSVCSKFRKGFDINSTTWCYFRMIYTFRHVPRVNRCNRMPFSSARKHSFNEMSEWFIPRYTRGKSREKNFSVWVICRKTFFFQSPSSATMGSEKLRQFTLTTFSKTTQERRRRKQAGKLMLFAPSHSPFSSSVFASYKWAEELFIFFPLHPTTIYYIISPCC